MSNLLLWLTTINAANPDLRRRGRNLVIVALGMAALATMFLPFAAAQPIAAFAVPLLVVAALIFVGIVFIGRAGFVTQGAWLLIGVTLVSTLSAIVSSRASPSAGTTAYNLVLVILLAGVLLPPVHIWSTLVASLAGLGLVNGLVTFAPEVAAQARLGVINSSLLLVMSTLICFVSARGSVVALAEAETARRAADEAGRALAASNAALEQRVEDRTVALRQIAEEHRAAAAALAASLQAQQDLNRIIAEQAVPVIPVSAGTIVVPLVGNISGERADQILTTVLTQVEHAHARTVVLDVTGVALVDTHVAAGLLRIAQATRLMGATTVLAGIRPEVAQALVGLGVDLADLHTVATLREAL